MVRLTAETIVIDHDILGWGESHKDALLGQYRKFVRVDSDPGLERRKSDTDVAAYCKKNSCDLMTGDTTAYEQFFEAGVTRIQILRYDWIGGKTDKAVYLIQIIE